MNMGLSLAAGVFFGNWLLVPLIFTERTFSQSFAIGLIAGLLMLGTYTVIK